ncbi:hypothetical protein JD276_04735 [Leucobacter sp. CSA1]|uniref:Uncharacterized protein n=1 Tax=Leucobacter chromiisoli TaxID=2796471 RepID=A0A934UUW4_9MICO|nr:hypothetical protein [Leucobacter chromiisoli]MBK0418337.1 hypothetical protein [Leucobacter chromiisoli]
MTFAAAALFAAEDAQFDPDTVSPGAVGFLMTGLLAVAVILLGVNLVRRLRRSQYRAEIREELEAELAARDAEEVRETGEARGADGGSPDAGPQGRPETGDEPRS